jgi:hypothetical protein
MIREQIGESLDDYMGWFGPSSQNKPTPAIKRDYLSYTPALHGHFNIITDLQLECS